MLLNVFLQGRTITGCLTPSVVEPLRPGVQSSFCMLSQCFSDSFSKGFEISGDFSPSAAELPRPGVRSSLSELFLCCSVAFLWVFAHPDAWAPLLPSRCGQVSRACFLSFPFLLFRTVSYYFGYFIGEFFIEAFHVICGSMLLQFVHSDV